MTDWFQNEDLFVEECERGHEHERYVAKYLEDNGLEVELPEQTIRDHVSEADEYKQELDILVENRPCEIKSRGFWYTNPENFPYETGFIDTVSGWDAKDPEPVALLCISQKSKSIIVLPVPSTKEYWTTSQRWDRTREIQDSFYEAPIELWTPIEPFIQRMKELKQE